MRVCDGVCLCIHASLRADPRAAKWFMLMICRVPLFVAAFVVHRIVCFLLLSPIDGQGDGQGLHPSQVDLCVAG